MIVAKRLVVALAVGVALAGFSPADDGPSTDKLGKSFASLSLTDPTGKSLKLAELKDPKAVVVVFLSFDCPVSNGYAAYLSDLAKKGEKDGVTVIGLVPGDDPPAEIAKRVAEFKLPFRVLPDPNLAAADAFKAQATPEAFVLDHNLVLRYRGRIDDGHKSRTQKSAAVTSRDLDDALDAVVAGKDVKVAATKPIGCGILPRERKATDTSVTFHRDIAPILQNRCQECHRPGQVGPFSLVTYKQAVNWADDIKGYTHDRKMPPWKPTGGPGYKNSRSMPDAEIATLAKWVDAGCPEGKAKDALPPKTFSEEWNLGKPDLVLEVPEDFHVGPSGGDLFRCFVFPTKLGEDKYIVGYEVRPGNPRVVHHTLNFFNTTGQGREMEAKERAKKRSPDLADYGPGYSAAMSVGFIPDPARAPAGVPPAGSLGGYAPGQLGTRTPDGTGFLLPKGSDIILQVHYHRTGKPETDRTKLGLYFARKPVDRPFQTISVGGMAPWTVIPAGRPDYLASGSVWLMSDCTLHSVLPHMHLIGKSIKVTATPPGGTTTTLVDIPAWDYNWQETYWFQNPMPVKAGTRLEVSAVFDNSSRNPNNPFSPPNTIFFGEQTTSEMLYGFVGVSSTEPGQRVRFSRTPLDKDGQPTPAKGIFGPAPLFSRPPEQPPAKKADEKKGEQPAVQVPYQLTDTKHVRVRVKLNGKGPYNLILDTGAPAAFVTKAVAKAAGLTPDDKGWAPVNSFVLEGGLTIDKARVRVEDLFQLEGMNGLGLAGVELHGVIGYDILARYRITYDFTSDALTVVPLDFTPPPIARIGGKGQGGLEVLGPLMKTLAAFMGIKPNFEAKPRGSVGIEVEEKEGGVYVKSVLKDGPADAAGLKPGDKLLNVKDRSIDKARDLGRALDQLTAGTKVKVKIQRGEETSTLTVELGKGI
jgi:peroxiredoxin